MKLTRIISAIFIIIAGITGSYLIISAKFSAGGQAINEKSAENQINIEKPFKNFFAEISSGGNSGDSGKNQDLIDNPESKENNKSGVGVADIFPIDKDLNSVNLTDLVTENIKKGMDLTANKNGEILAEDNAKIEKTAEALVKDIIANPDVSIFNFDENIDEKKLKISSDNSPSTQVNYFLKMREIGEKYLGDPRDVLTAIKATFEKGDNSQLKNIVENYSLAVDEAMKLEVPLSWVDFHKKAIAYVRNSSIVYDALAGFEDDPIKAYLANEAGPTLMAQAGELQILFKKNLERLDSEF